MKTREGKRQGLRLRGNTKGSVLLLVMIAAPVAAILFFSLIEMVLISKRQVVINRNIVGYSTALDAVLDYTNYAIKNRWCMTSTWTRDTIGCNLTHARSFERMVLDMNSLAALTDINSGVAGYTNAGVVLGTITTTVPISSITGAHPLADIITNLEKSGNAVSNIQITVTRVDNINVPRRGRESYLDIRATLLSGGIIFRNLSAISATSRLMIAPRELNYFSLVVPENMHLDGTISSANGDFSIPSGTGGTGVSFESPVFVNGDIFIPDPISGAPNATTFSNKVILGGPNGGGNGGRLMLGATPFTAPNSGDLSSYLYSVIPKLGGFKKGVDVDGVRDSGLDVLSGNAVSALPVATQANLCSGINSVYYRLQDTNQSDLVIKSINSAAPNQFDYYIGLTQGNMFLPQGTRPYFISGPWSRRTITDIPSGTTSSNALNGQATMYFRFDSGNLPPLGPAGAYDSSSPNWNIMTSQFALRDNAEVTIKFRSTLPGPPQWAFVHIEMIPVVVGGNVQRDVFHLRVSTTGYLNPSATIDRFSIYMKAYDLGTYGGRDRRYLDSGSDDTLMAGHTMDGWLHFKIVGGALQWRDQSGTPKVPNYTSYVKLDPANPIPPNGFTPPESSWPAPLPPIMTPIAGVSTPLPDETFDYQAIVNGCLGNSGGANSAAFQSVNWNSPFVNSTRYSWHFAPVVGGVAPAGEYTTIPASGPSLTINNGQFYINSIVGTCIVPATTTVASGFITCDSLVILPRSNPLLMIGTFIAGSANIAPSAVAAGITFRNIYHPQSRSDLIAQGILTNANGTVCANGPLPVPVWWPTLTANQYDSIRKCNVISLRDKADPFTWSAVNPDCGLPSGGSFVKCQKHTLNYILSEVSRTSELQ